MRSLILSVVVGLGALVGLLGLASSEASAHPPRGVTLGNGYSAHSRSFGFYGPSFSFSVGSGYPAPRAYYYGSGYYGGYGTPNYYIPSYYTPQYYNGGYYTPRPYYYDPYCD